MSVDRMAEFKSLIEESKTELNKDGLLEFAKIIYNIAIEDASKTAYAKQRVEGYCVSAYVDKESILKLKLL